LIELIQDSALRKELSQKVQEMNFGDRSWMAIAEKTMLTYEHISCVARDPKF
jgi:hypothetical protein